MYIAPIMENQMEKNMENLMDTGNFGSFDRNKGFLKSGVRFLGFPIIGSIVY